MKLRLALVISLTALMVGCGAESTQQAEQKFQGLGYCSFIAGGSTSSRISSNCLQCTQSNGPGAVDGSTESYASIDFDPAGGNVKLAAIAQSGLVFPGGSTAGAFVRLPDSDGVNSGWTANTYLAGQLQETYTGQDAYLSPTVVGPEFWEGFIGFKTSQPFDTVEVDIKRIASIPASARVYEFCSDLQQ